MTANGNFAELAFTIVKSGTAKLNSMDMQGRVVYSKDMGVRAAGAYAETLDLKALDGGRYIGVLQVNGRITARSTLQKAF